MCTLITSAYQSLGALFGKVAPSPQITHQESKTTQVMQQILAKKEENVKLALNNKWQRYNPILIGGDVFTVGYLAFQGAQAIKPSIQAIAAVGTATLTCGVIAGTINIGVGIVSLVEGIQALRNGDKVLSARLLLDFVCCTAIGTIMILASLAIKLGTLAAVGAFFAANPWMLPVLFFIVTIPLLVELSYRLQNIRSAQDLGSQLKLDDLEKSLTEKNWKKIDSYDPLDLKKLQDCDDSSLRKQLSEKMEKLQADLGVSAATAVFDLLIELQNQNHEKSLEKLKIAKEKIKEWNNSLYLRMFQQILYFIGFCISMVALGPRVNGNLLNGTQSFFLTGANVIPLYMDSFWPFKRNTPIVVPKVTD